MEFIGLKVVGFLIWTLIVWYVSKRWTDFNSTSDVAARFNEAKTLVTSEIAKAEAAIEAGKANVDKLKALLPNG